MVIASFVAADADAGQGRRLMTIALAGNPNSGKTTVFNALTGLRQKVANYPGVTVDKKVGRTRLPDGRWVEVLDLPGTYSLIPQSPDERVAADVLRGLRQDTPIPDVVVAVIDASNLPRSLLLVSQLGELRRPLVVALNMTDIAARRGQAVDAGALARELGVPVVPMVGHRRSGIDALKAAIVQARASDAAPAWPVPAPLAEETAALAALTGTDAGIARRLLIDDPELDLDGARSSHAPAIASAQQRLRDAGCEPIQADIEARYRWIDGVVARVRSTGADAKHPTLTERADAILVHPLLGMAIFATIMAALFVTIFWLATPIMDGIGGGIAALGAWMTGGMADGALKSLLVDGIFNGVGSVVVFVPQIALLFLFLAVLEDSGYLARAAFLMDRLLSRVGLHGKSFIPLLSSFACAIPGVMATRTIPSPRERLATILVAPFMSCSARLPVYGLLIGTFFAGYGALAQGGIMLACYALGIAAAAATAWLCTVFLGRGAVTPFILELPTYKVPQASEVARQVWTSTAKFLTRAGTVIFALCIVLWALMYFPRLSEAQAAQAQARAEARIAPLAEPADDAASAERDTAVADAVAGEQLAHSAAGRFGHAIEPAIAPLGYDWKMGIGLVGAFAAREVFVGTMGIVYGVGNVEDENQVKLEDAMRADHRADGSAVWTPLVATSLLVWFVLAMQCMSTVAVVRRETGGWRWALGQLVYMNAVAYIAALATYQIGLRLVS